jgi:hypothetical protein
MLGGELTPRSGLNVLLGEEKLFPGTRLRPSTTQLMIGNVMIISILLALVFIMFLARTSKLPPVNQFHHPDLTQSDPPMDDLTRDG